MFTHKFLNLDYFINCIKIDRKHNELAEDQCFICQNVYISEKMAKIEVYGTQKVLLGVVYCRNSRNTKSIKGTNHRVLGWLGPFLPILPFSQKYPLFLPRYLWFKNEIFGHIFGSFCSFLLKFG